MSFIVITVLALGLFGPTALAQPDAGPVPSMSLRLEPTQVEAEVTQSLAGTAELQGTIEIDQPQLLTSNLTLTCVVNTGWPVEVDPNGTKVTGPTTIHFTTTVEVPPATSALLTGNVIVTASLKAPMLTAVEASSSVIVTVSQYYKMRIEVNTPLMDLERGQSDQVELNIYNDGNGKDTFEILLLDVPYRIRASLGQNQVSVHQDEHITIVMDVTVEDDSPDVQHRLEVKAVSVGSGGEYDKTYPVFINVRTFSDNIKAPGLPVSLVILVIVAVALVHKLRAK